MKKDKTRGYFYTRWGGRLHTFGTDEAAALLKFLSAESDHPGALHRWQQWANALANRPDSRARVSPLVIQLAEEFFDSYSERPTAETYYRKHLARWLTIVGAVRADVIDEAAVRALSADMAALKFAPKTISHDVKAVKTFWRWAANHYPADLVPRLELDAIKVPAQDPAQPNPISRERLLSMLAFARKKDQLLGASLELGYYALLRPTEIVRVLRGEGTLAPIIYPDMRPFDPHNPRRASNAVVVPDSLMTITSKVQHRTSMLRYVVLSEHARMLLAEVRGIATDRRGGRRPVVGRTPVRRAGLWARLDSYSRAVRAATDEPPSAVRDTAASDLHSLGVAWADIDLLLGHVPSGAGRSYIQPAWHTLLDQVSRLRL